MKKFITTISLKIKTFDKEKGEYRKNGLSPTVYNPLDDEKLKYVDENGNAIQTAFPIMHTIFNNAKKGDEICVYPIIVVDGIDNQTPKDKIKELSIKSADENENFMLFKKELATLSAKVGFKYDVVPLYKDGREDVKTLIAFYLELIGVCDKGDEVSACITYGTKPLSVLIIMALNYMFKVKAVDVNSIVYGRKNWEKNTTEIYDVKSLFYIDSVADNIGKMDLAMPDEFLKFMLEEEDDDE